MEVKEKVNNVTVAEKDPIFTLEQLKENIDKFIYYEKRNNKLLNSLAVSFAEKGLDMTIAKDLFLNRIETKDLNEIELQALCISIYDYIKEKEPNKLNKDYVYALYPRNYWYSQKIDQIRLMQVEQNPNNEWVMFNGCTKLNEKEYQTYITPDMLLYLDNNRKIRYDKNLQRASKVINTPYGVVLRENYNKEGLKDLEKRFLKEDIMTTQISLTMLKVKGKEGEFEFNDVHDFGDVRVGNLNVKIVFDESRKDYFPCIISDGAHRKNALIDAIIKSKKEGKEIKNGISCMIRFLTIPEAKQLTNDSFKVNETDKVYRSTLDNTIENQFVNNYIDSSYYYKDRIARSTQEEKTEAFWGSFSNMKESIKLLPELDLKNEAKSLLIANDMGKCTKVIIDYLIEDKYNNNIVEFEKSIFSKKNMSIGWLIISYRLRTYDKIDMISLAEKVYNKQNEYKKVLEKKDYKETFNYFLDFINKEIGEENV